MNLEIIDYIFILIILVISISALIRGFLAEVFSKLAFFLGILFAIMFYRSVSSSLLPYVQVPVLAGILGFVLVFIGVYLVIRLVQLVLKAIFSHEIMRGLDKSLGFLLGILEGLILVGLILMIINSIPYANIRSIVEGSFFQKMFIQIMNNPEYINSLVTA